VKKIFSGNRALLGVAGAQLDTLGEIELLVGRKNLSLGEKRLFYGIFLQCRTKEPGAGRIEKYLVVAQ